MLSRYISITRNQSGFTMVELMVVIIIIGILSAIALPNLAAQIDRAKTTRVVSELKAVKNLVELYKVENGEYPSISNFKLLVQDNGLKGWGSSMKDPWDRAYYYYVNESDLTKYYLWSDGPKPGGSDDIVTSEAEQGPLKEREKPDIAGMQSSSSIGE